MTRLDRIESCAEIVSIDRVSILIEDFKALLKVAEAARKLYGQQSAVDLLQALQTLEEKVDLLQALQTLEEKVNDG